MKKRRGPEIDVVPPPQESSPGEPPTGGPDSSTGIEPSGGRTPTGSDECPSVTFEVALTQPTSIEIRDGVRLLTLDGVTILLAGGRVMARDPAGLPRELGRCLDEGVRYAGEVVSIEGGKATVNVRAV